MVKAYIIFAKDKENLGERGKKEWIEEIENFIKHSEDIILFWLSTFYAYLCAESIYCLIR